MREEMSGSGSTPDAALGDLTVLDLCDPKGQMMGKALADMGARVIKVEPPEGDPGRHRGPFKDDVPHPDRSLFFWYYNTSKESVTLDLARPRGRELFLELARGADVLLESFDPGHLDSLGLGYGDVSAVNPRIIYTSLTGFGQTGPYRHYRTSDLVAMAMGGIMNSCGYDDAPGTPPIRPDEGHAFLVASYYGLIGTLVALLHRDATGQGQHVDVSVHEAVAATIEAAVPWYIYQDQVVRRQTGRHHSPRKTPPTQYLAKDGRYVNVFGLFTSLHAWTTLVRWLEEAGMAEDLADERYREIVKQRVRSGPEVDHVYSVVGRFIAAHTADDVYRGAQERRFPWGIVRAPEENLEDPHFREDRGIFAPIQHDELGETYLYPGRPYVFSETPWRARRAPTLGEHNRRVFVEGLGLSEEELGRMREEGVV